MDLYNKFFGSQYTWLIFEIKKQLNKKKKIMNYKQIKSPVNQQQLSP
jgi:hypothetical protein